MALRTTTWVIKASKFCNLRCGYCYEWNDLAKRERMSLDTWRAVFNAMLDLREESTQAGHESVQRLVLHGGEPLALPQSYLDDVMALKTEVFEARGVDPGTADNAIQTNFYRLHDRQLDYLLKHRFSVGVSFDLAPGVRLNVAGQPSEAAVGANIQRAQEAGLPLGAITVLAKHTRLRLVEIFEYFAERRINLRVLPLFDGPAERPEEKFAIHDDEVIEALQALFVHWFETGIRIAVAPFIEHFEAVLRKMTGLRGLMHDRKRDRDGVIIVNLDGTLYRVVDAYEAGLEMGNISRQSWAEVVSSGSYRRSLERDEAELGRFCSGCEYAGACSGWSVLAGRQPGSYRGRCPLTYRIHQFMESYLCDHGFDAAALQEMLQGLVLSSPNASTGMVTL